jgi:4-hydroxy-tetrahydrodipicolinate reductase
MYSPNITTGINLLIVSAQLIQKVIPQADIKIVEEHFKEKSKPSGTAVKIAHLLGADPERDIMSVRAGGIVGVHEVIFGLPSQTIRLKHESISKSAFGLGAIRGAKYILKKDKGFYTMEEMVSGIIHGTEID